MPFVTRRSALALAMLGIVGCGVVAGAVWSGLYDIGADAPHTRPVHSLLGLLTMFSGLLIYAVFRRYLQSMHVVRPIMVVLVLANLVNIGANWLLIQGHWGFPALGVVGAAYATVVSRLFIAAALFAIVVYRERDRPSGGHERQGADVAAFLQAAGGFACSAFRLRQQIRQGAGRLPRPAGGGAGSL